jgi:hypothetical protein
MITFSKLGDYGRLGNQLFQIACTISTALDNNDSYGFPNWEYSKYFNLDFCFFDNIKCDTSYQEPDFSYNKIPYSKNMDLVGYFQSEKYFINHKDMILELLTPKDEIKQESGLCGVHIRRGDYVKLQDYHYNLDMSYYEAAMSKVNANKYIIFSDDINWCKQQFKGRKFQFSEGKTPHEDLALMSKKCEHMIMANSSFSWWGSYLNQNPNKIVIAPSKWFGPKLTHNTKDLLPENWIKI